MELRSDCLDRHGSVVGPVRCVRKKVQASNFDANRQLCVQLCLREMLHGSVLQWRLYAFVREDRHQGEDEEQGLSGLL